MNTQQCSVEEFNKLLSEWAEKTLEGLGFFDKTSPQYEKFKETVISQLRTNYSDKAIVKFLNPKVNRKMDSPDGFARITGPCGDTMEMYIRVKDGRIIDASFQTDGCNPSHAAGEMTAEMANGADLQEAVGFTQQDVLDALDDLPEENRHCALLAVNTLRQAVENYKTRMDGRC